MESEGSLRDMETTKRWAWAYMSRNRPARKWRATSKPSRGYPIITLHGQLISEETDSMRRKRELLLNRSLPIDFTVPLPLEWEEVNEILEKIIRAARIIHLDWVELYFAEDDDSCFFSPRNELEALSSILSSIDESISRCESDGEKALVMLRGATISRIESLELMQREGMIYTSSASDADRKKLSWWKEQGIETKLDVAYFDEAGRGLVASDDIQIGDIVLEIPMKLVISEDIMESAMESWPHDFKFLAPPNSRLVWIMREWHMGSSKFKNYFDFLPAEFKSGMSFGPDALDAIKGTPLHSSLLYAKKNLERFVDLANVLLKRGPDMFPFESYTLDDCKRAWELWYSNKIDVFFSAEEWKSCLVPIAGFFNHSQLPHILHGSYDSRAETIKFIASRPCRKGEQCYLSYGNGSYSGEDFIMNYGFLPKDVNNNDVIPLDFENILNMTSVEVIGEIEWPYQMVREKPSGGKQGWTEAMLTHIQAFKNGSRSLRRSVPVPRISICTPSSLEEAYKYLGKVIFNKVSYSKKNGMFGHGDIVDKESQDTPWDVKVAVEHRTKYIKILTSLVDDITPYLSQARVL